MPLDFPAQAPAAPGARAVPWHLVGSGWSAVVWHTPVHTQADASAPGTLLLVGRGGERYPITAVPFWTSLEDVSPDGRRMVFVTNGHCQRPAADQERGLPPGQARAGDRGAQPRHRPDDPAAEGPGAIAGAAQGFDDGWRAGRGALVQSMSMIMTPELFRRDARGRITPVRWPSTVVPAGPRIRVHAVVAGWVYLGVATGGDGFGIDAERARSLIRIDPITGRARTLAGPGANGGAVTAVAVIDPLA